MRWAHEQGEGGAVLRGEPVGPWWGGPVRQDGGMGDGVVEGFLEELPGAEAGFPFGEGTRVWKVGGKVFALEGVRFGRPVVSVKALPENVVHLVAGVDGVEPGYHLNKRHWVTVDTGGIVEPGLVLELIAESHAIIVAKLPRRLRLALDGTASGSLDKDR
ncbi:MmcQ/YjbR family DNA-binding protein [Rathayibacter agropyri]|uniref:MmcQ/YjbR family DNA-binding protein n=1 Tax=Rathayibacter agropyri TaxID=1634927 RepID=UPI001CA3F81B